MDRYWLLTWTTYGTWLPGDTRGFVGRVRAEINEPREVHNVPGTEFDANLPGLHHASHQKLKAEPIYLAAKHADILKSQFEGTASFRGWKIFAGAIMANHVHLVVGVNADPAPEVLLQSFKSYGSRSLNNFFGKPKSGTWWTVSGSTRKLPAVDAVEKAVAYVLQQERPLVVWCREDARPT